MSTLPVVIIVLYPVALLLLIKLNICDTALTTNVLQVRVLLTIKELAGPSEILKAL